MTTITEKLDELGKPAWIALVVLGFLAWWPLGLATLAYLIWSRRMGCGQHGQDRWPEKMNRMRSRMWETGNLWQSSSGNKAFDEYRAETLRRLEEEQREFQDFLERLRLARDKQEFDQFMAERRAAATRPTPPAPPAQNG